MLCISEIKVVVSSINPCRFFQVSNKIVGEARLTSNKADEGWQLHILLDYLEIFGADRLETKAIADDDKDMITPLRFSIRAQAHLAEV